MKRIFVDGQKCLSCHSCELACAAAHSVSGNLFGAAAETPLPSARVSVEESGGGGFPIQCRHCDDPRCARACVTGALCREEDGAVLHDESRCIGCWMCAMACPFGVIGKLPGRSAVSKCDLCAGREGGPACTAACPTKALTYGEMDAFSRDRRRAYLSDLVALRDEAAMEEGWNHG